MLTTMACSAVKNSSPATWPIRQSHRNKIDSRSELKLELQTRAANDCSTLFLFALLLAPCALMAADKPNIIVILSDDFGYGSTGAYGADGKLIQTPNLDRLAKEGRRFTDANTTSSVCSPTRYSVLTGRYCWRTSLTHEVLGTSRRCTSRPRG